MRRARNQEDDSLDMLLDTITNTFGGIVFLAMLIVIMTGSAKPKPAESSEQAEFREIEKQIDDMTQKKSELEKSKFAQQTITSMANLEIDSAVAREIRGLADRYIKLRTELNSLFDVRIDANSRLTNTLSQKNRITHASVSAKSRHDRLAGDLRQEIDSRTIELDVSKELPTQKSQTLVMVLNHRIYLVDSNLGMADFRLNTRHFEKCSVANAVLLLASGNYRPAQNAGVSLNDPDNVKALISGINKNEVYLTVVIFENSFEDFHNLKKSFRELGVEFELTMLKTIEKISESPRSSEPKVQM